MLPLRSCFCPRGVHSSSLNRSTAFALCRRGCRSCHFGTMVRTPIYSIFSRAILAIFVTFVSHPVFHAVGRFARFFITSMSGLVVGLLSPFSAFLRTPTLTAIGATLLFGILLFVYLTLGAMRSTPPPPLEYAAPSLAAQSVYQGDAAKTAREQVDPNMKRMLNDIYGDFDPGQ